VNKKIPDGEAFVNIPREAGHFSGLITPGKALNPRAKPNRDNPSPCFQSIGEPIEIGIGLCNGFWSLASSLATEFLGVTVCFGIGQISQ